MIDPKTVQCIICGAKPGWACIGAPNTLYAGRRIASHDLRVADAKAAALTERPVETLELTAAELIAEHAGHNEWL